MLLELVLNRERHLRTSNDFFVSPVYLFNMDFERSNQLMVDLLKGGTATGAQIRVDVEFKWMELEEPLNELGEIKTHLDEQMGVLEEDMETYLTQIRCLLGPFDPNNRSEGFSYHNPFSEKMGGKRERHYKNIFFIPEKPIDILNDYLLYSGVKRTPIFLSFCLFRTIFFSLDEEKGGKLGKAVFGERRA